MIRTQVMEIQIPLQKDVHELQNKVSSLCHNKLRSVLDRACSSLGKPGQVHRIDRLELDIGELDRSFSEYQFVEKVKKSFNKELGEEIGRKDVSIDLGRQNGRKDPFDEGSMEGLFEDEMPFPKEMQDGVGDDAGLFSEDARETFQKRTRDQEEIKKKQDTEETRNDYELLEFFLKTGVLPWWASQKKDVITKVMERLVSYDPSYLKQLLGSVLIRDHLRKRLIMQFSDPILKDVASIFYQGEKGRLATIYEEALQIFSTDRRVDIFEGLFLSLAATENIANEKKLCECLILHVAGMSGRWDDFLKKTEKNIAGVRDKGMEFVTGLPEVIEELRIKIKPPIEKEKTIENQQAREFPVPKIPGADTKTFSQSESIYINSSGIIILAKFLPEFFSNISLVKDDDFISEEAAQKGALFLRYLTDGSLETPEHLLALCKIICGIPLTQPIEKKLRMTTKEKEAGEFILEKTMRIFPRLKDFTMDEFREVFLQREGSLSVRDHAWLLRVKSEGRDVLLGGGWCDGVVQLPWMRDPVFVEWM